jgi:hypothetical protein
MGIFKQSTTIKMREIQPLQIWKNGEVKTASILDAQIISDNLQSNCTFYWMLKEADSVVDEQTISGQTLADGNASLSGEDYDNWDGSNDYAFSYIANQINVTLL